MDWLKKLENIKKFYQEPGFVLPEPWPTEQAVIPEPYGWDFMAQKSSGPREGSTVGEFKDALTEKLVPDLGISYKSPKGWSVGAGPWAGESDPSINFQFRKEFDDGGVATPKRGLVDGPGSYSFENITTPRENLKRLAELIQKADIDDELEYLMSTPETQLAQAKQLNRKKIVRHKKGKMTAALRQDFNRLRTDENSIRIVANLLGEDVEYVLDVIDEADNFSGEAKLKAMMTGSRIKEKGTRAKFEKIEKWITSNAKKFDDPAELKKAVNKRFGSNNILNQTVKKNGIPLFTQGFTNEILGLKGFSGDTSRLTSTLLDNVYKTTIYNFNPKVRKQLTKEITNVLSGGPAKVTEEARTKIKNNPFLKKFGFDKQINGPIARLLFKEIGEDMYRNLQTFKQPRIGTDGLLKYLANEVNPKYKSMFMEAGRAIKAFQDRGRDGAAKFLKKGTKIMYDHKIPVSLIKNGYADEIEYVKVQPTSEYFNADIKNQQFDQKINNLLRKYEKATGPQKNILFNEILNKKDKFSKQYGGYLDDVLITKNKAGKIKFSTSKKTPIFTKDTNIIKEFAKSSLQTGELNKKQFKNLIKAIGCPDLAAGGRVGFKDGTSCFDKGKNALNSGKFAKGAQARNAAKFLNRAYKMGKWVWKWGVVPEAVFAGGDALIRMGYGATLDEGLLRATDVLFSGNQTLKADVLEIERQLGGEAAEVFRNVGNWKDRKDELESIKQQRASDHTVAGTEFAETNSGMSSAEVDKYWDPIQTAKEKELRDASVSASKDEQILAESYLDEAYDKSDTDSLSSKIAFYKNQGAKPMSQVGTLPDKTQAELNKRMSPQNFTRDMLTREPEIYHQVMDNLKKDLYPHQYFWDEKENFENIKSDKGVSEAQGHYNLSLALLDQALKKPLSSHVLDDRYTKEQVYGTQEGRGFLEKLNRKKFIRPGVFNATSNQLDDIYDMGRQGAASGGIAGVRRPNAIAPESGPAPQGEGLSYILNRVREW
jgi:hypothetical protein